MEEDDDYDDLESVRVRFIHVLLILCFSGLNNSSIYDPTSRLCWLGLSALCWSIMCQYICMCVCVRARVCVCVNVSNQGLRAAQYALPTIYGIRMLKNRVCQCEMIPWIFQNKGKKKLMPAIQCNAVFMYWCPPLCLLPLTPHVIASIVYCPFFFALVRAVCLSWLSADFTEQNACRWMKSNWGVPLIGTYVREQMAESHVTLRCMGIEQGLSLPAYDLSIHHQVSMKRNHHDELQWSIVMVHLMTAAPEPDECQPNFHRRDLVSIPGCLCSVLSKWHLIRFFSETSVSQVIFIPPLLHTHVSFDHYRDT
jgi:hypothetical protein